MFWWPFRVFSKGGELGFPIFINPNTMGQKSENRTCPVVWGLSPRQTTKAHVLYVPGVNLQLITQERDHKDPSQITAPHMTFGRTVCKTAVIFCQVDALFIAQLSCHVFDSAEFHRLSTAVQLYGL